MTYTDAIKMTPEELRDHPEVEQCACAHARGLHTYGRESRHQCKGRYTDGSVNTQCGCTEFKGTGLRLKNSLISLPVESRADVEVSPALIEHRKAVFNDLDPSRANDPAPWWLRQQANIEVEMERQQKELPSLSAQSRIKNLDIYLPVLLHFNYAHLITPQRSTALLVIIVATLLVRIIQLL